MNDIQRNQFYALVIVFWLLILFSWAMFEVAIPRKKEVSAQTTEARLDSLEHDVEALNYHQMERLQDERQQKEVTCPGK